MGKKPVRWKREVTSETSPGRWFPKMTRTQQGKTSSRDRDLPPSPSEFSSVPSSISVIFFCLRLSPSPLPILTTFHRRLCLCPSSSLSLALRVFIAISTQSSSSSTRYPDSASLLLPTRFFSSAPIVDVSSLLLPPQGTMPCRAVFFYPPADHESPTSDDPMRPPPP